MHLLKLPLKLKQNSKISNGSKCKYYITLFFKNVFSKNRSENEKVLKICKRKDPPSGKGDSFLYHPLSPSPPPPPGLISWSMPELNKMHSR